ncbi:MAG: sugar phosphate nucleotidyltransferase [Chitinophagales bacterium]
MKPTLLILAAGMGSRYGGLKQIDGVGPSGETIIDYSIYDAIRAGFGKVVFVIRHSFEEAFKTQFAKRWEGKIAIDYAYQEVNTPIEGLDEMPERSKPWGTAHATLVAADLIQEPFAVINADDYYGADSFQQIADFLTSMAASDHYAMVGFQLKNTISPYGTVSRGICEADKNGYLKTVVERTKIQRLEDGNIYFLEGEQPELLGENAVVSMNFWGFHPNIFEEMRKQFIEFAKENADNPKAEFYIPLSVNILIQTGKIKLSVLTSTEQWYGVTYQEDRPTVVDALQKYADEGKYPHTLG